MSYELGVAFIVTLIISIFCYKKVLKQIEDPPNPTDYRVSPTSIQLHFQNHESLIRTLHVFSLIETGRIDINTINDVKKQENLLKEHERAIEL